MCTLFLVSTVAMVYYFYVKRNKVKEEKEFTEEQKEKDTLLDGKIAMINSYMVLNEQAAKQEISKEVSCNNMESNVKLPNDIETNQKEKGWYTLL